MFKIIVVISSDERVGPSTAIWPLPSCPQFPRFIFRYVVWVRYYYGGVWVLLELEKCQVQATEVAFHKNKRLLSTTHVLHWFIWLVLPLTLYLSFSCCVAFFLLFKVSSECKLFPRHSTDTTDVLIYRLFIIICYSYNLIWLTLVAYNLFFFMFTGIFCTWVSSYF